MDEEQILAVRIRPRDAQPATDGVQPTGREEG
jgi:hypothetical protein